MNRVPQWPGPAAARPSFRRDDISRVRSLRNPRSSPVDPASL